MSVSASLKDNFHSVEQRIHAACARAGRDPAEVRLIWVSKNHPQSRLLEAIKLGAHYFGENRLPEILEKFPLPGVQELHFIGRLQTNKIRKLLPLVSAIHSVDSLDLLLAVNRIAGELGLCPDIFLQVNTSREAAKGGFEPDALPGVLAALPVLPHLHLVGLMTMGPVGALEPSPEGLTGEEAARLCFRELANLLKACRRPSGPLKDLTWLSMGMSGDFEVAIAEGAHFIRIGTGLFGERELVK